MDLISWLSNPVLLVPLMLWSLVWKGLSLWKAATKKQLWWFVLLLVVNTLGIVEIAYLSYLNRFDIDKGKTLEFIMKRWPQR